MNYEEVYDYLMKHSHTPPLVRLEQLLKDGKIDQRHYENFLTVLRMRKGDMSVKISKER